jgi:alginate O-acetyltransferase complex protein AlgI
MSLSSWIRDYLFLPLASMRRGHWWVYIALVLSMALFGLWHGARTTFILWGVYQGLLLVSHRLGQEIKGRASFHAPQFLSTILSWGATFATISLGWILFRASDLSQALMMFASVFSPSTYRLFYLPKSFYVLTLGVIGSYFGYELIRLFLGYLKTIHRPMTLRRATMTASEMVELLRKRSWWWLAPMTLMVLLVIGIVISQEKTRTSPFIYTVF